MRLAKALGAPDADLPEGYTCDGVLMEDIKIGQPITMCRYRRPARPTDTAHQIARGFVCKTGLFELSRVTSIDSSHLLNPDIHILKTTNSTWWLKVLDERDGYLDKLSDS